MAKEWKKKIYKKPKIQKASGGKQKLEIKKIKFNIKAQQKYAK